MESFVSPPVRRLFPSSPLICSRVASIVSGIASVVPVVTCEVVDVTSVVAGVVSVVVDVTSVAAGVVSVELKVEKIIPGTLEFKITDF